MVYFKYKNNTDIEIPLQEWMQDIESDLKRIDESKYPITLYIEKSEFNEEKNHYKYSNFKPGENKITIHILPGTDLDEIKWSFMHEFRHFMQINIPELYEATFKNNDKLQLKQIVDNIKQLSEDDFYDMIHDSLPYESDAIRFATEKVGKNYRKHPLKLKIKQYLGDVINDKEEKNSMEQGN